MSRDMSAPNWARTLARLRRLAEELRRNDFEVIEPPNADLPPDRRYAQGGMVAQSTAPNKPVPVGMAVIVGEDAGAADQAWTDHRS